KENFEGEYYNGGTVPYAFERILLDEHDNVRERVCRGEKIKMKLKGWNVRLVPVEDPEQLEVVRWLYQTFGTTETSFRALALALNEKGIPGPGSHTRRHPGVSSWNIPAVKSILTNPHYCGDYRYGRAASGIYHRLVKGEIQKVEYDTKRQRDT